MSTGKKEEYCCLQGCFVKPSGLPMNLPDDGGIKHLYTLGELLPEYTEQNPNDSHLRTQRREHLQIHGVHFCKTISCIYTSLRPLTHSSVI